MNNVAGCITRNCSDSEIYVTMARICKCLLGFLENKPLRRPERGHGLWRCGGGWYLPRMVSIGAGFYISDVAPLGVVTSAVYRYDLIACTCFCLFNGDVSTGDV